MAIHWTTPIWLWPLLLILATGAVLWAVRAYDQTRPVIARRTVRLLRGLRIAALLLLILALAGPVLSRRQVQSRPPEVAVILEDSASMGIRDAGGDTLLDRWAAALAVAGQVDSLAADLPTPARAVLMRGNGLLPVTEFDLAGETVSPPTGEGTRLADLQRQAADRLAGHPVVATVLISDGQETAGRFGVEVGARRAAGRLFVVGVGDPTGPPDRVLKDLRYPDTAYAGDEVEVTFAVDHRYPESRGPAEGARRLTARLVGPDGVVAEKTVSSAERLVPFVMSFEPGAEGLQTYNLEVEALDNERFLANNKASLVVDVRRERARILLLTTSPSWTVRFLAQAALSEARVELSVVYPAATGLVYADSLTAWEEPGGAEDWLAWDAVVLGDWVGPLGQLDWGVLQAAVARGLGLMVVAGSGSGPGGGPVPAAPPAGLAELLPVQVAGWRWVAGPFFVTVPAAAVGHPIVGDLMRGEGETTTANRAGNGSGAGLAQLPPLSQLARTTVRSGAHVLLNGETRSGGGAGAVMNLAALAGRGQGRVLWFGGRSLWELGFWERAAAREGADTKGDAGRRLVRNMLVWTAEGDTEAGLDFTGRQAFFAAGEPIRLGAQWRDMRGQPVSDRQLSVILRGGQAADSTRERTFALRRTGTGAGLSEVVLPPLAAGRYSVQLVGAGEPPVLGRREDLLVTANSIEMTQVRLERRRLQQLATQGNGRYYDAGQAEDRQALLADLAALAWHGDEVELRRRVDFRAGWPLLILVAVLLGSEWYLRRRHGLL